MSSRYSRAVLLVARSISRPSKRLYPRSNSFPPVELLFPPRQSSSKQEHLPLESGAISSIQRPSNEGLRNRLLKMLADIFPQSHISEVEEKSYRQINLPNR